MLLAGLVAAACGDDADPVAGSSVVSSTVAPATSAPASSVPVTDPATTVAPTTVESTTTSTTEPPVVGWQLVDSFPSLAYLPCCGSNWTGVESPEFPADTTAGLAPGIYYAQRIEDDVDTEAISFQVARFRPCAELPEFGCEQEDWAPDEMGISGFERGFTLPLDETITVGLSGSPCAPDTQMADGSYLSTLMKQFDASYEQLLGGPFRDGESAEALVSALADTPSAGFSAPPCEGYGELEWQADEGPAVLLQNAFPYDDTTNELYAPTRASPVFIHLTAVEIADDGELTLYFYAGYFP
jgi:hypothetical protein